MSTRLRYIMIAMAILLGSCVTAPSSFAQNRMTQILTMDNPSRAFIGIVMKDVTEDTKAEYKLDEAAGVIVESVETGSPAETAGLEEDDVIMEFAGIKVRSMLQFRRLVQETPIGRKVEMEINRAGKRENLAVQIGERTESMADDRFERMTIPFGDNSGASGFLFRRPDVPEPGWEGPSQRTGRLGIEVQPLSEQLAETLGVPGKKGVLVSSVMEKSPSDGKLKAGDVIVQAEDSDIETPQELADMVRRKSDGSVSFKVIRDKKVITVKVNLAPGNNKGFRL
jgi:serine protease Do